MIAEFKERLQEIDPGFVRFEKLETLQVNLGDQCNMRCSHCHIGASPSGKRVMGRPVIDKIAKTLERLPGITLDITGEGWEILKIEDLETAAKSGKELVLSEHCYCCTAGEGSSCTGALVA